MYYLLCPWSLPSSSTDTDNGLPIVEIRVSTLELNENMLISKQNQELLCDRL